MPRAAVILNPTKFTDLEALVSRLGSICADEGWDEPLVLETTADDPGVGQTKQAVEEGVDVVCALGGDGTVRSVATPLVGTTTALGLLPGGTGNLLARNLGLPVESIDEALRVVLTGTNRAVDVGLVRLFPDSTSQETLKGNDQEPDDPRRDDEEVFLVMTGIGVDAEVMANTSEKVKGVIGWPAYVFAGLARMFDRGFRVSVSTNAETAHVQHAQTVIVGNCGALQGGLDLLPDAKLDDGALDAVLLAPRGPFGWVALATDLASRHHRGHPRLERREGQTFAIVTDQPMQTQVDGDPKGAQYGLTARILPGALTVRVPA